MTANLITDTSWIHNPSALFQHVDLEAVSRFDSDTLPQHDLAALSRDDLNILSRSAKSAMTKLNRQKTAVSVAKAAVLVLAMTAGTAVAAFTFLYLFPVVIPLAVAAAAASTTVSAILSVGMLISSITATIAFCAAVKWLAKQAYQKLEQREWSMDQKLKLMKALRDLETVPDLMDRPVEDETIEQRTSLLWKKERLDQDLNKLWENCPKDLLVNEKMIKDLQQDGILYSPHKRQDLRQGSV